MQPENEEIKTAIRNMKKASDLKDDASKVFKRGEMQSAIDKFNECLAIDEYNI